MARLSLSLLGPMKAMLDGSQITLPASTKARALLAYLAVESCRPHRRDARTNLRNTLSDLRTAIGDRGASPLLLATRETIQFSVDGAPASGSGQALLIARDHPQVTLHLDVVVSQAAFSPSLRGEPGQ